MGFSDLPSYARCLLEISPDNLFGLRTADQQYWLNAVRAARTAAESALQISEGKTNSWNDILKMPEFKTKIQELPQLPTNPERPAADRTNPRESSTKRRKVSRRQPARTNSSQSAGVDGDRIQLLRRNNVSENSKVPINAL